MDIIDKLEQSGVSHGYATYWHANAISVLSAGKLRALPVLIDGGGALQRQHFMVAERWFEERFPGDRFFVLIDGIDRKAINLDLLYSLLGKPLKTLHGNGIDGLIFSSANEDRLGFRQADAEMQVEHSAEACRADYRADADSIQLKSGSFGTVRFWAKNTSTSAWLRSPTFRPGLIILDSTGNKIAETRSTIAGPALPGANVPIDFSLEVPPIGEYTLRFSFVIEGYTWCGDSGALWAQTHLTARD
jgi:hypothetical protein